MKVEKWILVVLPQARQWRHFKGSWKNFLGGFWTDPFSSITTCLFFLHSHFSLCVWFKHFQQPSWFVGSFSDSENHQIIPLMCIQSPSRYFFQKKKNCHHFSTFILHPIDLLLLYISTTRLGKSHFSCHLGCYKSMGVTIQTSESAQNGTWTSLFSTWETSDMMENIINVDI